MGNESRPMNNHKRYGIKYLSSELQFMKDVSKPVNQKANIDAYPLKVSVLLLPKRSNQV